jgi:hypothetical protein
MTFVTVHCPHCDSEQIVKLTFRTLFRPSDAIFEEPRVESGAGAIYRPFYAL